MRALVVAVCEGLKSSYSSQHPLIALLQGDRASFDDGLGLRLAQTSADGVAVGKGVTGVTSVTQPAQCTAAPGGDRLFCCWEIGEDISLHFPLHLE